MRNPIHMQNLTEKKKVIFWGNWYKLLKFIKVKPFWKKGSIILIKEEKYSKNKRVVLKKKSTSINFKSHINDYQEARLKPGKLPLYDSVRKKKRE